MEDELRNQTAAALKLSDLCVVFLALLAGCQPKKPPEAVQPAKIDYAAPLPEGEVALRKIDPSEYPDFSNALLFADIEALKRSTDHSIAYFSRAGSAKVYPYLDITHERAIASLRAFRDLLNQAPFHGTSQELDALIAQRFEVYQSVGAPRPDGSGY